MPRWAERKSTTAVLACFVFLTFSEWFGEPACSRSLSAALFFLSTHGSPSPHSSSLTGGDSAVKTLLKFPGEERRPGRRRRQKKHRERKDSLPSFRIATLGLTNALRLRSVVCLERCCSCLPKICSGPRSNEVRHTLRALIECGSHSAFACRCFVQAV